MPAPSNAAPTGQTGPIDVDKIDADARKVVQRLARAGFETYFVGGCVRDLLLGRRPKDFDVATSATPAEIKQQFRNSRIIGRRFRLAHVFFGQKIIETATFRSNPKAPEGLEDGSEEGGEEVESNLLIRHDNVFGTSEEDARRRDFTVNGLFYDLEAQRIVDYVGGREDLDKRLIRSIGDASIRFQEDPIRILRALKFAARLSFDIDPADYGAVLAHRGEIAKCAPPRVLEELYRLLRGGAARRSLELLDVTGVLGVLSHDLAALLGREGDHEGSARLFGALERLDAHVADGYVPSNSLILGLLCAPFVHDALYVDEEGGAASAVVDEISQPILDALRVSRRDSERLRQILTVQRRIGPSRRRRSRSAALARREFFSDALMLFELVHGENDPGVSDELQRWRAAMITPSGAAPDAAGGSAPADGPPRRRRRRRGGRGRGAPL